MGAPKRSTDRPFGVHKIEGSPKSGKSDNKKDKGKNGGSNNASSGSVRTNSLFPPKTTFGKGIRSRTPSVTNTPTSSPSNSPETKTENLSRVVSRLSCGVQSGSTDTEDRERSDKQSLNTSPHTSPPQPQPSSLPGSSPPAPKPPHQPTEYPNTTTAVVEVSPANKTLGPSSSGTGLQDKQDNVKPAALPTFDLPTPPASPEIQNQTVPAALEDGPASFLLGSPSGLADKDKQDDFKSAALLSSSPLTPPASPTVPADLENVPAPSLLETASDSPDKDTQVNVKSAALPSSKSCHYCF